MRHPSFSSMDKRGRNPKESVPKSNGTNATALGLHPTSHALFILSVAFTLWDCNEGSL